MGDIPSTKNMPSSKFTSPENFGAVKANTNFTIKMKINNLETGNFVNAESNYYAAPQQLNKQGNIIGHSHFVVQQLDSFTSTKVLDPNVFAFFKGVNTPADAGGIVSVAVDQGLPEGLYRLASINTDANHTPAVVPIAQHGSLDDTIYVSCLPKAAFGLIRQTPLPQFSATKDGKPATQPSDKDKVKGTKDDTKDTKDKSKDTTDKSKDATDKSKDTTDKSKDTTDKSKDTTDKSKDTKGESKDTKDESKDTKDDDPSCPADQATSKSSRRRPL